MKNLRRVLALVLCAAALLATASCGQKKAVLYENYSYSADYYTYWLSRFKASFLYSYSDVEDTEEYYDSILEGGKTADEVMTELSEEIIARYLVAEYLADACGLTVPENYLATIDAQITQIVTEQAEGSKAAFNRIAAAYGINLKMLREIYLIEAKCDLFESFYKQNSLTPALTDAMREEYCVNNYAKAQVIFVGNVYRRNVDENGNIVYDDSGSSAIPLTEEEKKVKNAILDTLDATLTPANFAELQTAYNEDPAVATYKNGYYFSLNLSLDETLCAKALTAAVGSVTRIDTDYGVYYILREETEPDAYCDTVNADFFDGFDDAVVDEQFSALITEEAKKVTFDRTATDGISIKTVKPCYYF